MQRRWLLGLVLGFLPACTYDNGDANNLLYTPSCGAASESIIDTDATLTIDAGIGAGAFVEYSSGGHYRLTTACDTVNSGTPCHWDILVSAEGAGISQVTPDSFESGDSFVATGYGSTYQLLTTTDVDLDSVSFDVTPGSALQIDALLDKRCTQGFLFWSGGGAVHSSATSQVWLTPTSG